MKTSFTSVTACGECCVDCKKKNLGLCDGCIETNGHCTEWNEQKGCPIAICANNHNLQFCGLCDEFPCEKLTKTIIWNPNAVENLSKLAMDYKNGLKT